MVGYSNIYIEHRTSNIEHRTSNIEHRTSNTEYRTSNTEYRIPKLGRLGGQAGRRRSGGNGAPPGLRRQWKSGGGPPHSRTLARVPEVQLSETFYKFFIRRRRLLITKIAFPNSH